MANLPIRAHLLPRMGGRGHGEDVNASGHIVSAMPLPGFKDARQVLPLYVWQRPPDIRDLEEFAIVGTTQTNRIRVAKGLGGSIYEWVVEYASDIGEPVEVQFLNHYDLTGRAYQAALFFDDDQGRRQNPTQAGGWQSGHHTGQATGYSLEATIAPGILTHLSVRPDPNNPSQPPTSDGSTLVRVRAMPATFESDTYPTTPPYGSSVHDPIYWPGMRLGFDLTVNYAGIEGVHRCDGVFDFKTALTKEASATYAFSNVGPIFRFAFDKFYAWSNGVETRIDGVNMLAGLTDSDHTIASVDVDGAGTGVTVTLDTAHGRNAFTQHYVTIQGNGSAQVNGTHLCTFSGTHVFTFTATATVTGEDADGSCSSVDVPWIALDDSALRTFVIDQTNIANREGDPADETRAGIYIDESPFTGGANWHAIIARADGTSTDSIDDDFAIAHVQYVGTRDDDPQQVIGASIVPHGDGSAADSNAVMALFGYLHVTDQSTLHAQEFRTTTFIVMGKYQDVLDKLDELYVLLTGGVVQAIPQPIG